VREKHTIHQIPRSVGAGGGPQSLPMRMVGFLLRILAVLYEIEL
jgi:hypothetical protein